MEHTPTTTTTSPGDGFVLLGEAVTEAAAQPPGAQPADPEEISGVVLEDDVQLPEHLLALDALFVELEPVRPEQIVLTLSGSAAARLASRAAFLGLLPPAEAAELAYERDWQALLRTGLTVAQLALLVRAEPWLPPVHHGLPFCRWLVSQAVLSEDQLERLHATSLERGWPIFQVALEEGLLEEERYVQQLARFADLEVAQPTRGIGRTVLVGFPVGWVEHFDLVPLEQTGTRFVVALSRPLPPVLLDRLAADAGAPVECRLTTPALVSQWRRRWLRAWWRIHHPGRVALSDI